MLDFLRTEFLQTAEGSILKGDYGTALYNAYVVNVTATRFFRDEEIARISGNLVALVQGLIEADFEAIAQQRGLTVTPENKTALLQEHSPHYVRFRELLTQPIPEVLLRNYYKILPNSKNESINDLYKTIKTYYSKNFKKKYKKK